MNLIFASLALGALPPAVEPDDSVTEVPLKTRVYRNWKFRLPAESWQRIGKAIHFPAWGEGTSFKAQLDGTSLMVDTDGDGELDTKLEEAGGVLVFTKGDDRCALRLRSKPDWSYAPASVQRGKMEGVRVSFIDQNNNGRFDDYGADAVVIGAGRTASFLSKVVSVKGKLYTLEINADGSKISYAPYTGDVASIDFKVLTKGKVLAAVLKSADGKLSFDVSRAGSKMRLPAGSYGIHSGLLSFGGNQVQVRAGRAKPIELGKDTHQEVRFGGPVAVEFGYKVADGKYHFSPDAIWYYGRSGEEYHSWAPLGSSPKIEIRDRVSKEVVAEAVFPPNC